MNSKILKTIGWIIFAIFPLFIGLYPLRYLLADGVVGLLNTKNPELLSNLVWKVSFNVHILFGGIALMIGWIQFHKGFRTKRMKIHRGIGKVYVIAGLLSALGGVWAGYYATGGPIAQIGFMCLGVGWFGTTLKAYLDIRQRKLQDHQQMMIYSYSLCFAAVTLRLWLTPLQSMTGDFISAYQIVAWLCWVPNLLVAFIIIRRTNRKVSKPQLA
ncbi:MAG: DUF2306 domain-containing protein [Bacteroidia bacterium]|nr:DUF2306 domain-containing protein [Bacteroidia bacterium]